MSLSLIFSLLLTPSWGASHIAQDDARRIVLPPEKPLFIVAHGATAHDEKAVARAGIERAAAVFQDRGWPVYYLNNMERPGEDRDFTSYAAGAASTNTIHSLGGEHFLPVTGSHIFIAGGHSGECLQTAASESAGSAFRSQRARGIARPQVALHLVMDGIYSEHDYYGRTPDRLSADKDFWSHASFRPYIGALQVRREGFENPTPEEIATLGQRNVFAYIVGPFLTTNTTVYEEGRLVSSRVYYGSQKVDGKWVQDPEGTAPELDLIIHLTSSRSLKKDPTAYKRLLFEGAPAHESGALRGEATRALLERAASHPLFGSLF